MGSCWSRMLSMKRFNTRVILPVLAVLVICVWIALSRGGCERAIPVSKPASLRLSHFTHPFLIPEGGLCSASNPPFLLIVIESHYSHVEERRAIRKTWGSPTGTQLWADGTPISEQVLLIFLFGVSEERESHGVLRQESVTHKDVIQADFQDSYRNLTLKTTAVMKWVSSHCSGAKFVLKADDDVFLHIPNWISALKSIVTNHFFLGHSKCGIVVERSGKFRVRKSQYPYSIFPPYTSGAFYAFPGHMAPKLLDLAEHMPFFPVEDVFFSGILRMMLGAELVSMNECFCFSLFMCNFAHGDKAGAIGVSVENMHELWEHFKGQSSASKYEEFWLYFKLSIQSVLWHRQ